MKRLISLPLALAIVASGTLAGCTTATPYQPYRAELAGGVHGGFSEQRLGTNRFRVRFHGNELTARDRVEGYLLYRAAELTLQNGYDWFLIADRHTEHDVQTYVRPDPIYRPWYGPNYGYWRPLWRYYNQGHWGVWHPEYGGPFWGDRADISRVESFEAEADIVLHRGPVSPSEPRAIDARRVMADLGPSIRRPRALGQ